MWLYVTWCLSMKLAIAVWLAIMLSSKSVTNTTLRNTIQIDITEESKTPLSKPSNSTWLSCLSLPVKHQWIFAIFLMYCMVYVLARVYNTLPSKNSSQIFLQVMRCPNGMINVTRFLNALLDIDTVNTDLDNTIAQRVLCRALKFYLFLLILIRLWGFAMLFWIYFLSRFLAEMLFKIADILHIRAKCFCLIAPGVSYVCISLVYYEMHSYIP